MENLEELKALKQENSKLKLEARLRKSLASELERQKTLVQEAKLKQMRRETNCKKLQNNYLNIYHHKSVKKFFQVLSFQLKVPEKS